LLGQLWPDGTTKGWARGAGFLQAACAPKDMSNVKHASNTFFIWILPNYIAAPLKTFDFNS
jgi:hypothetical protein